MDSTGFDVERRIAKEAVLSLFDCLFLGIRAEFPINDDDASLRQVFERDDDAVTELTGRRFLDLKCFHASIQNSTVGR